MPKQGKHAELQHGEESNNKKTRTTAKDAKQSRTVIQQ
jgi:hypothetical protein